MMSARKSLDHRAGALPDIRADGDNVTFRLEGSGVHRNVRLVIRCDADGNVWASLVPKHRDPD